jgi:hypothetical protein
LKLRKRIIKGGITIAVSPKRRLNVSKAFVQKTDKKQGEEERL